MNRYRVTLDYQTEAGNPGSMRLDVLSLDTDSALEMGELKARKSRRYIARIISGQIERLGD